jgi:hypothetical protein
MNHRNRERIWVALVSGIGTTIGQSFLLSILFPRLMTTQGQWIMLGLLCFNGGAAGLILFLDR